jgi:hypothetical protein
MMSLFLVVVMAASIIGVAYAHWSDFVTIEGSAKMGTVTFGFTRIVASWDCEMAPYQDEPKDVGYEVCTLHEPVTDEHTGYLVHKLLTFEVTDAYPQYWAINKFTLDCGGSIPVKIQNVILTLPVGFSYVEEIPGIKYAVWDDRPTKIYDIWIYVEPEDWSAAYPAHPYSWGNAPPWYFPGPVGDLYGVRQLKGVQLEFGEELLTEVCVWFYQEAEECHTYTFDFRIDAVQWNKYEP